MVFMLFWFYYGINLELFFLVYGWRIVVLNWGLMVQIMGVFGLMQFECFGLICLIGLVMFLKMVSIVVLLKVWLVGFLLCWVYLQVGGYVYFGLV